MSECTCDQNKAFCEVHVPCDEDCRALYDPQTKEEIDAALEHWKDHTLYDGCSHGN